MKHTPVLHKNDLPAELVLEGDVAVDTETMGLVHGRDRLCLVQVCDEAGRVHLVQVDQGSVKAPNLKRLVVDKKRVKIFHYARFDLASLYKALGVMAEPIFCTRIASRLARTYTDRHSLKDLCQDFLKIDMSKKQQSSDWGAEKLTQAQIAYAMNDVIHLHGLRGGLQEILHREGKEALAQACFDVVHVHAMLDVGGYGEMRIFDHS